MESTSTSAESPARRRLVFLSTVLGAYLVTANVSTMNVAFPDLERTFDDATRGALTWVLNAYTIVFAALLIPAGRLADRFGRRQTFWVGLGIFAVASLLVGAGPTLPLVIAARTLQGVGGALVTPASLGLLLAATPGAERTATVAKWGAVTALGVATGPSIGALVIDLAGWRWAFLGLPAWCLVSYLAGRGRLPDTEVDPDAPFPDVLGAIVLALSMALFSFSIIQVRGWGLSSGGVLGAALGGAVLMALVIARSRRHAAPAVPLALFGIRSFRWANLATFVQSGALGASLLANILWLTGGWNYSILEAGLATLPSPLLVAVLAPTIGRLGSRYDIRRFAIPGSLTWAVGQLLYALLVTEEPNWLLLWLPVSLVVAVGVATTFPLVSAAAVSNIGPGEYAVAGAINQIGRQFGATIGVAALVTVVGEGGGLGSYRAAWLIVAASGPVAAVAVALIGGSSADRSG